MLIRPAAGACVALGLPVIVDRRVRMGLSGRAVRGLLPVACRRMPLDLLVSAIRR